MWLPQGDMAASIASRVSMKSASFCLLLYLGIYVRRIQCCWSAQPVGEVVCLRFLDCWSSWIASARHCACGRQASAEARLQEAQANGEAMTVRVQSKQFAKSLQCSQLTAPAQLLMGIGPGEGHLHIMFVYRDDLDGEGAADDSISLSYRLPVMEDDFV
jgi:hypothetical protein